MKRPVGCPGSSNYRIRSWFASLSRSILIRSMRPRLALVTLVGLLCAACASTPARQVEDDDRTGHIYFNNTLGFRLTIPRHWTLVTRRQSFTVPERIEELELEPPELEAPDSPAEALGQKTPAND